MSKVLKIAGVSVIALGLILGLTIPAVAASSWADDSQNGVVKGKVLSIGDQEFVIQSEEEELTIKVDEDTRYYQLYMPGRIMALVRQRLQVEQQSRLELRAWVGNGQGQGLKNRVRAAVEACNQVRLQERLAQAEGASLPRLCWLRGFCPFGGQAEFADISVGDTVAVWLADGDNLAERVLIIELTDYACVSGTIEGVSSEPRTITIAPDVGGSITLGYNESTEFILKGIIQVEAGQSARVIYDSDNMLAKTVVVYVTDD